MGLMWGMGVVKGYTPSNPPNLIQTLVWIAQILHPTLLSPHCHKYLETRHPWAYSPGIAALHPGTPTPSLPSLPPPLAQSAHKHIMRAGRAAAWINISVAVNEVELIPSQQGGVPLTLRLPPDLPPNFLYWTPSEIYLDQLPHQTVDLSTYTSTHRCCQDTHSLSLCCCQLQLR